MNRRQRMKNRATARQLRRQLLWHWRGAMLSIGVDAGATGGDRSAVAFRLGRVVSVHLTSGAADFCMPHAANLRFEAVRITEGDKP